MEHYEYWQHELPNTALSWGMFGENFTTEGLVEDGVNIGGSFHIGEYFTFITSESYVELEKWMS